MNGQYLADIMNTLFETGVLKENERIVGIVDNCLLLERYTGKSFSYRICDFNNQQMKYLFSRQKQLPTDRYDLISEKINEFGYSKEVPTHFHKTDEERASELLSYIFTDILPKHGLTLREEQMKLSLAMLKGLQRKDISLCEAEVGTGKTHAYILAVVVNNLFSEQKAPTVISTSTIALQKALINEYIPQISEILIEHRIIDVPLSFVVRKGKNHYRCDNRFKGFIGTMEHLKITEQQRKFLEALNEKRQSIDLDDTPLNNYLKNSINVSECNSNCGYYGICSYHTFVEICLHRYFDFHITNHNFLLADLLVKKRGRNKLLPKYNQVVIDEAHKLTDAATSMYGLTVSENSLSKLIYKLLHIFSNELYVRKMVSTLSKSKEILMRNINGYMRNRSEIGLPINTQMKMDIIALIKALNDLSVYFFTLNKKTKQILHKTVREIDSISERLQNCLKVDDFVITATRNEDKTLTISATPKHLGILLSQDFWDKDVPIILTSGTMSVDGDFSHLKRKAGLYISDGKIKETRTRSPFNYMKSALLYLPRYMPYPDVKNEEYNEALLIQIVELIKLTYGHTLLLFTSYRQMEQVFPKVQKLITKYPLFIMGKGKIGVIDEFRNSKNGVLFASDSAGEGIDLAGDILSSVIIVKLPFPIPDTMSEYELSLYDDFGDFLTESVIPTMLIKLRQWFGRGIRRETDSCVFSILDGRAARKYKNDILSALPDMPVTRDISDVGRFILNKKDDSYFE